MAATSGWTGPRTCRSRSKSSAATRPVDPESLDDVEWLFWVGCAGAYEDRAKKTPARSPSCSSIAGVSFGVLGNGETCTGDPARRAGNESSTRAWPRRTSRRSTTQGQEGRLDLRALFQHAEERVQGLRHRARGGPPHPTAQPARAREEADAGRAVGEGAVKRTITYHDPCYIGRHNGVYTPPRELLQVLPGAKFVEMERNSERSFCCGAGGARKWWRRRSVSGSTSTAPRRPSAPAPTRSRSDARSAG